MKDQISLLHVIGGFLTSAALGFLIPSTDISPNPFGPAPFWIVILTLSVLLIGLVLGLLVGHFPPTYTPTRLQWLGISMASLALFLGAYLLSTHGTHVRGAFPIVFAMVIVSGMQLWSGQRWITFTSRQGRDTAGSGKAPPSAR